MRSGLSPWFSALLMLAGGVWASSALRAADHDWPQWRGLSADGYVPDQTGPVRWTTNDVAWKVRLPGKSSSTPILWKDSVYLTTPAEGDDAVLALDAGGRQRWLTRLGPAKSAKHRTLGSSSNASPVTDGAALFVYFKSGHLAALDFDGKVRWETNLVERFGEDRLFWDQGTSPVVTDQHVILARMHGGDSWIAGFDKRTGELRWQQPRNYKTAVENDNGYNTPLLFVQDGRPGLIIWGAEHLTAHDARDGTLWWSCGGFNPQGTGYWPAIATPVIAGDLVIVPVGRDDRPGQSRLHAVRTGGRGDVSESHRAWKREDVGVFVTSPVLAEGRVYLLRHRGQVTCLDPQTGKTVWEEALPEHRAPYYASPLVMKGRLYAAREDGTVFAAAVGGRFELLSENPMGERIVASPVPMGNGLLLRGDEHLFHIAAK